MNSSCVINFSNFVKISTTTTNRSDAINLSIYVLNQNFISLSSQRVSVFGFAESSAAKKSYVGSKNIPLGTIIEMEKDFELNLDTLLTTHGSYSGYSGGPYFDNLGNVIAFHVSSASEHEISQRKVSYVDVLTDVSPSFRSLGEGYIIFKLPNLVSFLQEHKII